MKKRIIISSFDSIYHPVYAGGGAHAIHEVAKRLSNSFSVMVIAAAYKHCKATKVEGVQYRFIGPKNLDTRIGHLLFNVLLAFAVRREDFDLWIENFSPPFSTSCLQIYTNKPVIGLAHMLSGKDMRRKYKLPFEKIEQLGLRSYNHVITTTAFMKKMVSNFNQHAQVKIISNGYNIPTGVIKPSSSRPYILYLGRIEIDQKGLDLLLKAFAKIALKTSYQLVIAGAGSKSEEDRLETMISDLQLENRVSCVGRVGGSVKSTLLAHAEFVVAPSRFETFSMTALEAFASKKTVVIFDIPELSWIPAELSYRALPFSVKSLENRIWEAVTNKSSRIRRSITAYNFSKSFTWDIISEQYRDFIEEVLAAEEKPVT